MSTNETIIRSSTITSPSSPSPSSLSEGIFSDSILSHLAPVRAQVDAGSRWLKRHTKLTSELVSYDYAFHKSLGKLVEHEQAKIYVPPSADSPKKKKILQTEMVRNDKMETMWNAQCQVYKTLEELAVIKLEEAKKLEEESVKILQEAMKSNQAKIKQVHKDAEIGLKSLNSSLVKVNKAKHKAMAVIRARDQQLLKEKEMGEALNASESSKDTKKKGIFSRFMSGPTQNDLVAAKNASFVAEEKVKSAKATYEEAMTAYNLEKRKWETETLPYLQNLMETIERERILFQKSAISNLVDSLNAQVEKLKSITESLSAASSQISDGDDVKKFASLIENDYGPSTFAEPMRDEIVNWDSPIISGVSIEEKKFDIFHQPLASAIANQKSTYPDLQVPRLLKYLVDSIANAGGFKREGIFRISAEVEKVSAAKNQISTGAEPEFSDPFIAADILKFYLRELPDNLFGTYYQDCINLAKDEEASLEDYRKFYSEENLKIPAECRSVIDFIVNMMLTYTAPEFSECSKMSLRNYAIMFSPSIMRPKSSASDDENEWINYIQNAPYETLFLHKLAQAVGKFDVNPPIVEEKQFKVTSQAISALQELQSTAMMNASLRPSSSPSPSTPSQLSKSIHSSKLHVREEKEAKLSEPELSDHESDNLADVEPMTEKSPSDVVERDSQ